MEGQLPWPDNIQYYFQGFGVGFFFIIFYNTRSIEVEKVCPFANSLTFFNHINADRMGSFV